MKVHKNAFHYVLTLLICVSAVEDQEIVSPRASNNDSKTDEDDHNIPYYVTILFNKEPICAGTIIDESFILTAAFCVDGGEPNNFQVRVGSRHGGGKRRICAFEKHDMYNWRTQDCDIAILQLCRRLRLTDDVRPIPFEKKRKTVKVGTPATLGGIDRNSRKVSRSFKQKAVQIVGHKNCGRIYNSQMIITDNMMCARKKETQNEFCVDTVGAPLVLKNELVGVLSWSEGCYQDKFPEVFTRVVNFSEWIEENIDSM